MLGQNLEGTVKNVTHFGEYIGHNDNGFSGDRAVEK